MINAFRLHVTRPRSLPSFDLVGILLRLDAHYRQRRHVEQLTQHQLDDIGIGRAELARVVRHRSF